MLVFSAIFFVLAIVAAIFGFGGVAAAAVGVAQILFWVFLGCALVTLIVGLSLRAAAMAS